MTYMMIRADEYSLNNLEKGGLVQNCPTLLVESVQQGQINPNKQCEYSIIFDLAEGYGAIGAIQDLQLKTDILDKIDVWMTVKFVGKTFGKGYSTKRVGYFCHSGPS